MTAVAPPSEVRIGCWLAGILLAACGPLAAQAANWQHALPAEHHAPLQVDGAVALADGGFVLVGTGPDGRRWLARHGADGGGVAVVPGDRLAATARLQATGDGIEVLPAFDLRPLRYPSPEACRVQRDVLGLDLRLYDHSLSPTAGDAPAYPAGPGRFAVFDLGDSRRQLSHFGSDCQRRDLLTLPRYHDAAIASRDGMTGVAFSGDRVAEPPTPLTLHRFDRNGMLWSREQPFAPTFATPTLLQLAANGDALLLAEHRVHRYDSGGALRWQTPVPGAGHPQFFADSDGHTLLILAPAGTETRQRVLRFAADGQVQAVHALEEGQVEAHLPGLQDLGWFVLRGADDAAQIVRFGADARPQPALRLAPGERALTLLADGQRLLLRPAHGSPLRLLPLAGGAGQALDAPRVPTTWLPQALRRDGDSVFLLAQGADGTLLQHWRQDGEQRWTLALPAGDRTADVEAQALAEHGRAALLATATRVCIDLVAAEGTLSCVDRHRATVLLQISLPPARGAALWRLQDDGAMQRLAVECAPAPAACNESRLQQRHWRADGRVLAETTLAQWATAAVQVRVGDDHRHLGVLVAAHGSTPAGLHSVRADGSLHGSSPVAAAGAQLIAVGAGGSLLVLAGTRPGGTPMLQLWDGGSAPRWQQPLATEPGVPATVSARTLGDGDWLIVERVSSDQPLRLSRRDAQQGALRWSRRLWAGAGTPQLQVAEAAGLAVLAASDSLPGRALGIDLDSGEPRTAWALGSTADAALAAPTAALLALADDGTLLSAHAQRRDGSLQLQSQALPQVDQSAPRDALAGVWHADDSLGQGLLLHAVDARTLAGGWFAFGETGGYAASGLRWYSLFSEGDGQGAATLTLQRSRGGQFAAPPAVPADTVGEAELRLLDADRALLRYRLSGADMVEAEGVIPLRRTLAASGALGTGDLPAEGLWFDPALPGQGLLLHRFGRGQQGLAGAWFTFDPEGAADDADQQHWFSLSGERDSAGAAAWTLGLQRSLGGRFDQGPAASGFAVGSAGFRLRDCQRAEWTYAFSGEAVAGAVAGRSGSLMLQRLGPCPLR